MSITIQDVGKYFDRFGWEYSISENNDAIKTGVNGEYGYFEFIVFLERGWLTITTLDLLPEIPEDKSTQLMQLALELNAKISYARIALVDKKISVIADIPVHTKLDYDLFSTVLEVMPFFADQIFKKFNPYFTTQEK